MITKLTIAIPTYNRSAQLAGTVARLLPQLTPEVEIVVLDNHSSEPLDAVLAPLRAEYPDARLTLVRNPVNIGGNANIIRCLETGSGEWVWTLSDDDRPAPDAIRRIIEGTVTHAAAACINFGTSIHPRTQSFETALLDEFLARLDSFGNLLFITANVYHRARSRCYLLTALAYGHSCASQVVLFLAALHEDLPVAASHLYIADFITPAPEHGWPSYYFFYFYEIVENLPDINSQRKLARHIDACVVTLSSMEYLRWACTSQLSNPREPSPLLFLAKGAWLRAQYAPGPIVRWRWLVLGWAATLLHRHYVAFVKGWKLVHRLRHGKPLVPMSMQNAFHAHFPKRKKTLSQCR